MHEFSLIRGLLAQVREAALPHGEAVIDEVVIAIGPLSGVEPVLVASAFDTLTRDTPYHATRLVIEQIPMRLACDSCGHEYETLTVAFDCPECSSVRTRVIGGDRVILRRLVLNELEPQEAAR